MQSGGRRSRSEQIRFQSALFVRRIKAHHVKPLCKVIDWDRKCESQLTSGAPGARGLPLILPLELKPHFGTYPEGFSVLSGKEEESVGGAFFLRSHQRCQC